MRYAPQAWVAEDGHQLADVPAVMHIDRNRTEAGFTLIELMLVVGIVGILGGMAVMQIGAVRPGFEADGAMRVVMGQLNAAREQAIAHRREIQVDFIGGDTVRLTQLAVTNGPVQTVLSTVPLESGVRFATIAGIADTPDAFGNADSPSFGAAILVKFNTEGMLVDASGAPVNGTVFLRLDDATPAYRAVTVLGSTGRVRGYRWDGVQWTRV